MILDTNALSALLDKDTALLEVIRESRELALPVIVLGEFRFGIGFSRAARSVRSLAKERSLAVSCASSGGRDLRPLRGNPIGIKSERLSDSCERRLDCRTGSTASNANRSTLRLIQAIARRLRDFAR